MKINDYVLDKVLDKIKEITDTEELDDTKILIDMDNKLSDYITKCCDIKDMRL